MGRYSVAKQKGKWLHKGKKLRTENGGERESQKKGRYPQREIIDGRVHSGPERRAKNNCPEDTGLGEHIVVLR